MKTMWRRAVWLGIVVLLAASRFCHLNIVWVEEGYPTAAALEILRGKLLYRDIWFDKPPLFAGLYLLWGAQLGWLLRLAGTAFGIVSCWAAARAARSFWGEREALWAASFTAIFLTFDTQSAVMALTPDLLTVPLHFAAVALAAAGLPVWAGFCAGLALLFNAKALLILAACLLWQWRQAHKVAAGFAAPVLLSLTWMTAAGSISDYYQQVWAWGAVYSRDTLFANPFYEGARRTLNWAGFHIALVVGVAIASWKEEDWRWAAWLWLSLAGVFLGLRFFPRYYFHLLPVMVLLAASGFARLKWRWALALSLLLVVPVVRFGPRYLEVARGKAWLDLAMYNSSQEAANWLKAKAKPGESLLVWGYRPELYPLSGLPAATRYLDSQPLSGVIADRHLLRSEPSFPALAAANRAALLRAPRPDWIADGLGPYNHSLAVSEIMKAYMGAYEPAGEVRGYRLYHLRR